MNRRDSAIAMLFLVIAAISTGSIIMVVKTAIMFLVGYISIYLLFISILLCFSERGFSLKNLKDITLGIDTDKQVGFPSDK